MRTMFASCLGAALLALMPTTTAEFKPNLFFETTHYSTSAFYLLGGFRGVFQHDPPSPFDGIKPGVSHIETDNTESSTIYVKFFGNAIRINGQIKQAGNRSLEIDKKLQDDPVPLKLKNQPVWAAADNLTLGHHEAVFTMKDMGTVGGNTLQNVTITSGMQTQAPTFDALNKTVFYFAKDGRVNRDRNFVEFPWDSYSTVATSFTPVKNGQKEEPYSAISISNWINDRMVIYPPDNTSFFVINGSMTDSSSKLKFSAEPRLPGMTEGEVEQRLWFEDYQMSNLPLWMGAMDPTERYTIRIQPRQDTGYHNKALADSWLSSVTFYSGLWSNGSDVNEKGGNQTAPPKKSSAAAIAGGVVGGIVGAVLIALGVFLLVRHRRNRGPEKIVSSTFGSEEGSGPDPTPYIIPRSADGWATGQVKDGRQGTTQQTGHTVPPTSSSLVMDVSSSLTPRLQHVPMRSTSVSQSTNTSVSQSTQLLTATACESVASAKAREAHRAAATTDESEPSYLPSPLRRQEEDLGALEIATDDDYVVPPSYNPEWEMEMERRRARHIPAPPPRENMSRPPSN